MIRNHIGHSRAHLGEQSIVIRSRGTAGVLVTLRLSE